jgi:hypothetical protein
MNSKNQTTKHTCGGPHFGRLTPGCPRCDELSRGAKPVRWSNKDGLARPKRTDNRETLNRRETMTRKLTAIDTARGDGARAEKIAEISARIIREGEGVAREELAQTRGVYDHAERTRAIYIVQRAERLAREHDPVHPFTMIASAIREQDDEDNSIWRESL